MAYESALRLQSWQLYGCNAFELKRPQSRPLMPWTEEDIQDGAALIKRGKKNYTKIEVQ